jgi:hypothetical protein
MTTGMLADDEGLLTKQDAADLLQVAVDAASLAAERHWAAVSGDQPTGALPESRRPTMVDRKPPGRIPIPEPLATCFLSGAVLITQSGICGTGTEDPPLAWQPFAKTNGAPCSAIMRSPQRCRMAVRTSSATSTTRRRWLRA